MRHGPLLAVVLILTGLYMVNFRGCDDAGDTGAIYDNGQETGRLQSENLRLREAERQAAARLAVERSRSGQLVEELSTRHHAEALLVGVLVLSGCALAVALAVLVRHGRATP